jgi:hypothetical protein
MASVWADMSTLRLRRRQEGLVRHGLRSATSGMP